MDGDRLLLLLWRRRDALPNISGKKSTSSISVVAKNCFMIPEKKVTELIWKAMKLGTRIVRVGLSNAFVVTQLEVRDFCRIVATEFCKNLTIEVVSSEAFSTVKEFDINVKVTVGDLDHKLALHAPLAKFKTALGFIQTKTWNIVTNSNRM